MKVILEGLAAIHGKIIRLYSSCLIDFDQVD